MHRERAISFVLAQGNPVERARLHYILEEVRPTDSVIETLIAGQNEDGGFPAFWSGEQSSLDATCYRLAQAEQLGLAPSTPALSRAINFLASQMQPDASWQESEELTSIAPPWAVPGDLSATIYLTANCAYWLSAYHNREGDVARSSAYLAGYLDAEGHLPSFLHSHWLAGGLWYRTGLYDRAETVMGYLHRRLAEIQAGGLAWMVSTLRLSGVPANHATVKDACELLDNHQEQDGHWASEDGPRQDVSVTLEAVRGILLCR